MGLGTVIIFLMLYKHLYYLLMHRKALESGKIILFMEILSC